MGNSKNPTFAGDKEFEKIHLKEKFSYGLGDVACNVVYALTTSLLIYFYTNVVGISAAMIGTIMLVSRFFDGFSDVLIGHLVDRTHSKHGKSRAWILWMMIPYGIAAILLFTVPPATPIVKGIYVFITYNFCTTVVYTALNLPYATLATLMTRDTDQRAVVNLFRTGMSAVGNMIITAITFPLVTMLGDTQQAWIELSIVYAQYILGNRDLLGALASFESIPQVITVLVLSPFIAKFGKRNVALIGAVVAVIGTVSLFLNPSALNLALFACVMRGIGKGCFRGVKYSMLADVIEYGAWKSGIRVQGLMVSATTAGQKFGSGMTSAIFGALMSLVGFAGTATINAAQSQMLIGIYIIGNIIAWGGIGILLIFYKLDKIYPRIITEMKQREAAGSEA